MNYLRWLNFKATVSEIFEWIVHMIIAIILLVFKVIRFGIFLISSAISYVFGLFLVFGFYFAFTVFKEILSGTAITKTTHFGFFLLFFVVPILFGVIREIARD